jgi:hypothetical protein
MPGVPVARINRLIAQPGITPTQDTVRRADSQRFAFDSNMEMTTWVLIVGNVSTACIVHPEGTRVSA